MQADKSLLGWLAAPVHWHALSVTSVAIRSLVCEGVNRLPHRGRLLLMQRCVVAQVAVRVRADTLCVFQQSV